MWKVDTEEYELSEARCEKCDRVYLNPFRGILKAECITGINKVEVCCDGCGGTSPVDIVIVLNDIYNHIENLYQNTTKLDEHIEEENL